MKEMMKKIVDAFVSNASNRMHAIGTIASTFALAFGLAGAAQAAENYTLVLKDGVAYKSTDGGSTLGDVVTPAGLSYANDTWTMNGFSFETTAKTAVKVETEATITVVGSNTIAGKTGSSGGIHGLYVNADCTINGTGVVSITIAGESKVDAAFCYGVYQDGAKLNIGGSVTVNVTATANWSEANASGLYMSGGGGLLVHESATLNAVAKGEGSGDLFNAYAIYYESEGGVVVKDSGKIHASASLESLDNGKPYALYNKEPDAVATDTSSGAALTWNSTTYYKGSDIATDVTLKAKPGPVAEVTKGGETTQYTSLPAAFDAIGEKGTGTVKLLADIDLGVNGVACVPNGSDFTLDLNGKRIFQTEDKDLSPITYPTGTNGKLTINDSVGSGGITVNRASSATAETNLNLHVVCCNGDGALTVNGGTFAVTNNHGSAEIFYKEGNGTWTFNGGTYAAGSEGACLAKFLHCEGSTGKTYVTGGTYSIESKDAAGNGIYVANGGTEQIEITGGDFDVATKADWTPAFEFCGTCVIKGGMFDVTSHATGAIGFNVKEGGLLIVSNGTFSVTAANNAANCLNAAEKSRLEVAGGTFSATSGTASGYTSCATIKGDQGGRIVITGMPVINQPTGDETDNFNISITGASLDFTGYASDSFSRIYVSNEGNTGFVKGDMSKCGWLSTSGGHFSTRPLEGKYWCADDMRPVVNLDEETKADYPWMIGKAVAELVPGSGTNYTCVGDALTAAESGQTVKLITDATENISITDGKTNTLDLAGHVLKGTGMGAVIMVNAGADLTITDSVDTAVHYYTVDSTGLWTWDDENTTGAVNYGDLTARPEENAVVAVKGGAITGGSGDPAGGVRVNGTVVMAGGNIVGNRPMMGYCGGLSIGTSGDAAQFTLMEGRIIGNGFGGSGNSSPIVVGANGTLTMNGGEIAYNKGTTCVELDGGMFAMNAGLIARNFASNDAGGVLLEGSAKMLLLGGVITGNIGGSEPSAPAGGIGSVNAGTSLTVGGTAVVTNNFASDGVTVCNVYLANDNTISITNDPALATGAKIGVTSATAPAAYAPVDITTNGEATDIACFTSDNPAYLVRFATDHLILSVPDVSFVPSPVENATAAVYTNDAPVEKTGDAYLVPSNATATVVYTVSEKGYYFAGGMTAVTNDIDTSVNPATADAPEQPFAAIQVGDDAWALIEDGVCLVVGTGDMWSCEAADKSALWNYRSAITNVVIAGEVTRVGANVFAYMKRLRSVEVGASVTNVAEGAFFSAINVTNVVLGAGVESVGEHAFRWCNSLVTVKLPASNVEGFGEALTVTARITMVGGKPVVDWVPKIDVEGLSHSALKGKVELSDEKWEEIDDPAAIDPKYHFFKVEYQK